MKTSFINNVLNSQPILSKFALKLAVCKCLSFKTHFLLDLRFPLNMSNVMYFRQTGKDSSMDLFSFIRQNLTPLQKLENAVKQNDLRKLEELLNQGIDPNTALTKHGGDTALHFAARLGYFKCIEILLAHGANAETLNDFGISPLYDAIRFNHQRAALELLYKVNDVKSIEDMWLWDSNMLKCFTRKLSDELLAILIKATPCGDKTRENLRNNLIPICISRHFYKSLKYWIYCGNSMTSEQESDLQEILQPSDVSVQDDQDDQGIETEKIKTDFRDWQVDFKKNAGSLQYYCCLSIRRCFYGNCNVFRGVVQLPLPETLRKDVCFI